MSNDYGMIDFGKEALRKYGLATISLAVVAISVIVWFLTHRAAEPGTKVSVLWGFVVYTKSSFAESEPDNIVKNVTENKSITPAINESKLKSEPLTDKILYFRVIDESPSSVRFEVDYSIQKSTEKMYGSAAM